jgi:hypothetical protein
MRLPFTRTTVDFWRFSRSGRELARSHLNYETVAPYPVQEHASTLALDPTSTTSPGSMSSPSTTCRQNTRSTQRSPRISPASTSTRSVTTSLRQSLTSWQNQKVLQDHPVPSMAVS